VYSGEEIIEQRELTYDWHQLRNLRDNLLQNSDWRAVQDRTMPQAWELYRQALRDLPAEFPDPYDAVDNWPEQPE